ncbi:MAG: hypothetical protein L0922_06465, partial [Candidatus Mariimomonas ferrooxydans]
MGVFKFVVIFVTLPLHTTSTITHSLRLHTTSTITHPKAPHYLNHHPPHSSTLPQPSLTPQLHTTSTITHT